MFSSFHVAVRVFINAGSSCLRCGSAQFLYSTASALPRRDWRLSGHPAPPSLIENESQEVPLNLKEEKDGGGEGEGSGQARSPRRKPSKKPTPHEFRAHRQSLKANFPDGWSPPRKLSREAMDGLRALHVFDPNTFSTPVLAEKFRISPEAVRRILKSKWEPTREQRSRFAEKERRQREERIRANRAEERMKHMELEAATRKSQMEGDPNDYRRDGRARGINSKDRLTFDPPKAKIRCFPFHATAPSRTREWLSPATAQAIFNRMQSQDLDLFFAHGSLAMPVLRVTRPMSPRRAGGSENPTDCYWYSK